MLHLVELPPSSKPPFWRPCFKGGTLKRDTYIIMNVTTSPGLTLDDNPAGSSSSLLSPLPPASQIESYDKVLAHLQNEIARVTKEKREKEEAEIRAAQARITQLIEELPRQFGLPTLDEVYTLIGQRLKSRGKSNNAKMPKEHDDDINKMIRAGASYKQVAGVFKISSAAYYNRKRKMGLTNPSAPLSKRKASRRSLLMPA